MSARVLLALLALSGAIFFACFAESEERGVTYENGTDVALRVVSDSSDLVRLMPGETAVFRTRKSLLPDHIQAYDEGGKLRFDKVITWEELEANSFRVVIR